MDVSILVREVGVALSGFVVGASTIASVRYLRAYHKAENKTRRGLLLATWMAATIGFFALFQGVARAFGLLSKAPLDWRDWGIIILQLNALALLVTTMKYEDKWRRD